MEDQKTEIAQDEITLKDLIFTIKEYWKELLKNWWLIGLISLPLVAFYLYKTFSHIPQYNAEVRYIVEGQGGTSLGAIGGFLSTFGINRGSGGKTNPYKILEVAKSKRMIGDVLFTKSKNTGDFIANDIINHYNLAEAWAEKSPEMKDFRFDQSAIEDFNLNERKAFLALYKLMVGTKKDREAALLAIDFSDDTGIFSFSVKSLNEILTLDIATILYDKTKYFFEQQVLEDQLKSRDVLQFKTDSVEIEIDNRLKRLARFEDSSRGLISRQTEITKEKLTVEIAALTNAFGELNKSLQVADFELSNMKPLFLIIDQPYSPIIPSRESLIKNLILGCFLGGFLGVAFVISRKLIREAIED